MNRRQFVSIATGSGLSLIGCSNSNSARSKPVLKIVSSLPKSGKNQTQSNGISNAIQLAIDEHKGQLIDHRIELVVYDNNGPTQEGWDAESEKRNAKAAISDPDVMAYIGPLTSGAAKFSMPILNAGGMLQFSPTCTWPGLTKRIVGNLSDEPDVYRTPGSEKITFCRVCPTDYAQGTLAAVFAKEDLHTRKVYVLHDRELYGSGIASLFCQRCEAIGIQVLGQEGIDTSRKDFRAILNRINLQSPELLFYGGTAQNRGEQVAKDMVSEQLNCPLIVPETFHAQSFLDVLKQVNFGDRCFTTIPGIYHAFLTGAGSVMVDKYKSRFKATPDNAAIYGYESTMAFLDTVTRVGRKDREAIRRVCLETVGFSSGALGTWRFDANGDTTLQAVTIHKAINGAFRAVRSVTERQA